MVENRQYAIRVDGWFIYLSPYNLVVRRADSYLRMRDLDWFYQLRTVTSSSVGDVVLKMISYIGILQI